MGATGNKSKPDQSSQPESPVYRQQTQAWLVSLASPEWPDQWPLLILLLPTTPGGVAQNGRGVGVLNSGKRRPLSLPRAHLSRVLHPLCGNGVCTIRGGHLLIRARDR